MLPHFVRYKVHTCILHASTSYELDKDPYTYESHNGEDEGHEDAYADDLDEDCSVPKFSERDTDAFVGVIF
jgi:hypothetical protein